jgi:hypothetical protein
MTTKTTGLILALCFFVAAMCFADDPQLGTWKLNEAQSKLTPGTTKITMVVVEAAGDNVKVTVDGTDRDGKSMHNEWMGKFDGKDYPVTGNPDADMRSYKKIDDRTLEVTVRKDGKVTTHGRTVVSADGKSRTLSMTGIDAEGKKVTNKAVYDKQ